MDVVFLFGFLGFCQLYSVRNHDNSDTSLIMIVTNKSNKDQSSSNSVSLVIYAPADTRRFFESIQR